MNREQVRNIIFDKITDWTPYADAIDERIAQERTDELLDAILPQVNSAEELSDVPARAKLMNEAGGVNEPQVWVDLIVNHGAHSFPLTVVWQP